MDPFKKEKVEVEHNFSLRESKAQGQVQCPWEAAQDS